jgi:N-acyl-phosphatidylethanolamine-hydrolysing phospholipase D
MLKRYRITTQNLKFQRAGFLPVVVSLTTALLMVVLPMAGCSHNNENTLTPALSAKQQPMTPDGRYKNSYPGDKNYPVSCQQDCYVPQPSLTCEIDSPAEHCRYNGKQQWQPLHAGFTVRWLGHASFQIHTADGQQLLLDPVLEQFDWPVNWAFWLSEGFNRQLPAQLTAQELASTDAVLYSHIHYDHFNKADVLKLGDKPKYMVPLGVAKHFPQQQLQISEMAWYTQQQLGALQVHAVPAHHFSNRIWIPFIYDDFAHSSWNGWLLELNGKKLFFAGDTGYSAHFSDIKQKYGTIDVCLLPIASYHHETDGDWYRYVHTTPEDALSAAVDLGCKLMIPWGYGNASWKMGDLSSHAPLQRLLTMKQQLQHLPQGQVPLLILNEGEFVKL